MRGERSPSWQGGRMWKNGYVYILCPDHVRATRDGYVLEHRLVMERELGRLLLPTEVVHHINGVKDDNRPENLTVLDDREHKRLHHANGRWAMKHDCCVACGTTERRHDALGYCERCYRRRLS
jgi:hypothetical protein